MRDRIKTYVGVLRDNTAIVASVALFFLWLGITFQVPDFAVDGTFEPGLVAPWIVVAFCYALGYLVAVLWYRKIASLFLRRRFLVLVCLVMAAGVTIDIASSWNTDFFGSVSRVAYVGSILMCLGTTLIVVMTASIVAQIGARNTLLVSVAGMLVAATLMVALGFMGVWGKDIARLFVPLAMIPVNLLVFKGMPLRQVFMRGLNKNTAWPHKLLATSALHGAVFGFYIVAYSALGVEGSHIAFNGVCYGIAAVVLGVMMVAAQTDFNHLIYHRAFPAMAFGMLLICVCAEASVLGVGIVAAGYAFLHLIMCGVCSYLSKQFDLPAPWVISLTTLFFRRGPGDRCWGNDAIPLAGGADRRCCRLCHLCASHWISRSFGDQKRTVWLGRRSSQHRYEYGHAPGICRAISGIGRGPHIAGDGDSALPC